MPIENPHFLKKVHPTKKVEIIYKKTNVNSNLIPNFLKKQYFKLSHKSKSCLFYNIKFNKNARNNKIINFIIGGPNKYFKFNQQTQKKILNEIKFLSEKFNVNIIPQEERQIVS